MLTARHVPEQQEMKRCYAYEHHQEMGDQRKCRVRTSMRCADCSRPCCHEHRVWYRDVGPILCLACLAKRRRAEDVQTGRFAQKQQQQTATLPPVEESPLKPLKKLVRRPEKTTKSAPVARKKKRRKRPVSPEQRLLDKDLQKVATGRVPATVRSKTASHRRQRLLEQHPFKVGNCSRCYARRVLYQKRVFLKKVWRCEDCW